MTVKCNVMGCPWRENTFFCKREYVFINENGTCNWIYNKNGTIRPNWQEKGKMDDKSRE